jgi:hypothetical protein
VSEFAWIFQETGSAIKSLIDKFIEKPYFFYTEQDMHAFLYHKLISGKLGEHFVKTSSEDETILVHKEYPTRKKYEGPKRKLTRGHFDLAIIDPLEASKSHWRRHIKDPPYAEHTLQAAIEIGLNEIGNTRLELEHFDKDFKRLTDRKNNVKRGYLLFFVRRQDFEGSGMLPIIDQLPRRIQEKAEKSRDRTKELAIVYAESQCPGSGRTIVMPEGRSSWIG